MKDWFRYKTSRYPGVQTVLLVLTLFLGFAAHVPAQQAFKIRKVVLDAGHGGKDPGCHGHNSYEKEIVLSIALELGKMIQSTYPDVEVIYTRKTDVFIPLNERAAIANRNKADVFISIHCNYISGRNKATGSETYVLGLHRAEDNLEVAKRENSVILLEDDFEKTYEGFDPNSPEGHIILTMFQNAHLHQSIVLANHIENYFKKLSHIPSRGVKQAGFLVLRETTMPSVLVETGFLSTDTDENYLRKAENHVKVAGAMLKAFGQYKLDVEGPQDEIASAEQKPMKTSVAEKVTPPANTPKVTESKTSGPKQVEETPASEPVVTDPKPAEVVYRIQVAASSKSTIDARYHDLKDLEVIREDSMYKFVVGKFSTREDALGRLSALKSKGFQGAFITVYKDGQRVKA